MRWDALTLTPPYTLIDTHSDDNVIAALQQQHQHERQQHAPFATASATASGGGGGVDGGPVELAPARPPPAPAAPPPPLAGAPPPAPAAILAPRAMAALAAALPARFAGARWRLLYSTAAHGTSLQTLYRRAAAPAPPGAAQLLAVRDGGGHVFGVFASEALRAAPRFYGSGETFVFQLEVGYEGAGSVCRYYCV